MHTSISYMILIAIFAVVSAGAYAQSAKDIRGASALIAIENEPPATIIVDPPIPESLAKGLVFIQY